MPSESLTVAMVPLYAFEVMQRLQGMIDAAALKPKVPSRAKLEKMRRTKSGPFGKPWKGMWKRVHNMVLIYDLYVDSGGRFL